MIRSHMKLTTIKKLKRPDVTLGATMYAHYIKNRIRNNKNFMGVFVGQTGSGKTYAALSLAEILTNNKFPKDNICFTAKEFMKKINSNKLKKGDVIIWDESGVDMNAKKWASVANRAINLVLQTFRHKNLIVLFTLPYLSFLDSDARKLVHSWIELKTIDKEKKLGLCIPKTLQTNHNTGKTYHKFLRVKNEKGRLIKLKLMGLRKADDDLIDYYEERKNQFTKELNESIVTDLEKKNPQDKRKKMEEDKKKEAQAAIKLKQQGLTYREIGHYLRRSDAYITRLINDTEKEINIAKIPME